MSKDFKVNVGLNERCFRIILSILFVVLAVRYTYWLSIPALILFVSGVVGWCPCYHLFGISTNKKKTDSSVKPPKKKLIKKRK